MALLGQELPLLEVDEELAGLNSKLPADARVAFVDLVDQVHVQKSLSVWSEGPRTFIGHISTRGRRMAISETHQGSWFPDVLF
jgi:hypothetical protein